MTVMIVEDQANDLRIASTAAEESGFTDIEATSSLAAAREFLERALAQGRPLPRAIVLDLDLGYESGFELLRHLHGSPELSKIPVVVWTIMGDRYRQICEMFKVAAYVDKGTGIAELRKVLVGLAQMAA